MDEPLVETWLIHDRINRYLLDAVPREALEAVSASRGRTVGEQFAHLHNVRLMWLKAAAPDLLEGLDKLEQDQSLEAKTLARALDGSGRAIAELVARSAAGGGKVKGFKPHVAAFVGYLVSHESHHRGQIVLTLKQSGHPLDRKIAYGLWEWGVR